MTPLRVYAIDGIIPVVDPTAYVHPSAVLIGDVIVGPGCYVGPCASLRGDFGRIELRTGDCAFCQRDCRSGATSFNERVSTSARMRSQRSTARRQ